MNLPTIDIYFKQLASSAVARSERGIAILILKDNTAPDKKIRCYQGERTLHEDKMLYTAENFQYLCDAMRYSPAKLYAVRIADEETIADGLKTVEGTVKSGWVTYIGEQGDYTAIAQWVKTQNIKGRTYKGIVGGTVSPNDKHVVWLGTQEVTFADPRGVQTGDHYLPSLAGILASCNIKKGSTSFVCDALTAAKEPADIPAALDMGKLILVNDFDCVRIGLGINSMTLLTPNDTTDMKYIDIIETMDLIRDDIQNTFKTVYQGQYKNSLDNQVLFLSAVNSYFKQLAGIGVLDAEYENRTDIDTAAQREAWSTEKPEAADWEDSKVRSTTYKRDVFLRGDIKILGAMENLTFGITVF